MNCSEMEMHIDEFVDGELSGASRRDVQRHLERCATCRGAVEELRALLRSAEALPRAVSPPRDLFPEIRSALPRRGGSAPGPAAASRGRAWLGWAGLAASLLILLTATTLFIGPSDDETLPAPGTVLPALNSGTSEYAAAEEELVRATEQLLTLLEQRRSELPPETAAVVEKNLQIIDAAIADVKQALGDAPDDARNGQFLTALQRQKFQLLWKASRLSS